MLPELTYFFWNQWLCLIGRFSPFLRGISGVKSLSFQLEPPNLQNCCHSSGSWNSLGKVYFTCNCFSSDGQPGSSASVLPSGQGSTRDTHASEAKRKWNKLSQRRKDAKYPILNGRFYTRSSYLRIRILASGNICKVIKKNWCASLTYHGHWNE